MAEIEGIQLKITSDGSQAVREFSKIRQAFDKIRKIETSQKKALAEAFNIPNITKITPAVDNAKKYGQQLLDNISKSAEALNTIGKQFEATFGAMFKSISAGATAVAGAISFITKNALNIGGGFEAQMTNVKIISGATAEELEKLTAKAREMGAALPISAKDAAQAMELLAQRGTKAKDILVTVADVSALAISQNVDMASAADLLGSTMTNFGIALDDASKVTDIFNNACNQSALSMAKIINAMKYVGPSAGAVKMQLTEAVSALEVLTNAGLTGEMAGAGLALVLNKLAGQSHVMGVEVNNLDGSMRSLKDIFSELQKKGFSLAEATALFGMRGNKVALALANYAYTLEDNEKNLQKWGATQNAVTEKMKTWINIWNSFQSASEELHIEVFEQIKNQAKDSVNAIAELTREFSKWIGETKIVGDTLNAFLEGLGFSVPSISDFQSLLRNFNVQSFLDNVKSFGAAIKGIADSIVWAFSMIKTPLLFLIEHLGVFATISFWGWILGKGLQIPVVIANIAASFKNFYASVATLAAAKWTALTASLKSFFAVISSPVEITAFLSASKWAYLINPITAIAALCSTLGYNIGAARAEVQKASEVFDNTIKKIQNEIKDADADINAFIENNIKTGFEIRPDSYIKASDEVRKSFDDIVAAAQSAFKNQFSEALDFVLKKFPQLEDEAKKAGINLNKIGDNTFAAISKALSGDENSYKALPDIFRKVTERINQMNLALGKGNKSLIYTIAKFDNLQRETEKMMPQNKVKTFYEDIAANIRNVLANLPKQIEEANKYLNGSDGQLAIKVSVKQATDSLNAFVKDTADKFAIPEDIVKKPTLDRLNELAAAGNKTALELAKAWGEPDSALEDFIDKAKDAITYLGDSPNKFVPALQSMLNGIQKIDPVTGKLTEKFKKAHDALKEWANVTFDNLTNRIQKLRKAVEGGFLDKSVLEKELKDSLPQLKLQVISELEPTRGQFQSQSAYEATLASELLSKVNDLFGDVGTEIMRNRYDGKTGSEIGRSILRDSKQESSASKGYININGIEQSFNSFNNSLNPLAEKFNLVASTFADSSVALGQAGDSILSLINSIHTPAESFALRSEGKAELALSRNSTPNNNIIDYSSHFQNVINALLDIHSVIASFKSGNTFNIDIHQQGFNVLNKSDADYAANSAVSAIRSGLGNGGL